MEKEKTLDRTMLERALGYKVNLRRFSDIRKIIENSDGYRRLKLKYADADVVYAGSEHMGNPKLPNITVLPNLAAEGGFFYGSMLGHQHLQAQKGDKRQFQEIYEFLGYGAMLLRRGSDATLHILQPNEKIIVGTDEDMTLFNLGSDPLVTLDYANPKMNSADKDLEKRIGPLMCIYHQRRVIFEINERYFAEKVMDCVDYADEAKAPAVDGGRFIFAAQTGGSYNDLAKGLERLGIKVCMGGNIPLRYGQEFSPPLLELVLNRNTALFDALCMGLPK